MLVIWQVFLSATAGHFDESRQNVQHTTLASPFKSVDIRALNSLWMHLRKVAQLVWCIARA